MGIYALFLVPYMLIIAVPGIILIRILVRSVTLPRGLRRGRAAVCGRCSQEVGEITDAAPLPLRCPECGTKYTQAGLLSLGLAKRTRPGIVSGIASWTLLMLGLGSIATGIVASFTSMSSGSMVANQAFSHTIQAVRTDGANPTGAAGFEARFDGDLEFMYGSPVSAGTLTLAIRPDSGPATTVDIDPSTTSWSIPSTGETGAVFDRDAALSVLTASNIDTSKPYVSFEADELVTAVEYVHSSPDQAVHSVLQNGATHHHASHTTGTQTSNWYPQSLRVTAQSGDSNSSLRFDFESDTIDANYQGSPSAASFDGNIVFEFTRGTPPAADTLKLKKILLTIRPPTGWPADVGFNFADGTGSISRGSAAKDLEAESAQDAVRILAEMVSLVNDNGVLDPGINDLITLIDDLGNHPTKHDLMPIAGSRAQTGSSNSANPPGDGEPDGGFAEAWPATNVYKPTAGSFSSAFPIGVFIAIAASFVVYVLGIVGIATRRASIYPDRLVGPQGPPDPSAVGPRYARPE